MTDKNTKADAQDGDMLSEGAPTFDESEAPTADEAAVQSRDGSSAENPRADGSFGSPAVEGPAAETESDKTMAAEKEGEDANLAAPINSPEQSETDDFAEVASEAAASAENPRLPETDSIFFDDTPVGQASRLRYLASKENVDEDGEPQAIAGLPIDEQHPAVQAEIRSRDEALQEKVDNRARHAEMKAAEMSDKELDAKAKADEAADRDADKQATKAEKAREKAAADKAAEDAKANKKSESAAKKGSSK